MTALSDIPQTEDTPDMTEVVKPKIAHPLVQELRRLRRAAGMSLDDVAAASGVSKTIVSEWENGHHEPTLSRLAAYAASVGAPLTLGGGVLSTGETEQ